MISRSVNNREQGALGLPSASCGMIYGKGKPASSLTLGECTAPARLSCLLPGASRAAPKERSPPWEQSSSPHSPSSVTAHKTEDRRLVPLFRDLLTCSPQCLAESSSTERKTQPDPFGGLVGTIPSGSSRFLLGELQSQGRGQLQLVQQG